MSADDTSVRVATRIRPQLAREKIDMCRTCTFVTPGEPQITLGQDRAFTYDHVFDMDSTQDAVYNESTHQLIEGCFDGYNATVFAYGQTGSGKTYTMGTGFDVSSSTDERGIIPRAVSHLFNGIDKRRKTAIENGEPPPEFKVHAQFMELYNEEIIDLLDAQRDPDVRHKKSHIKIHEDALGGIYTVGVTSKLVTSIQETMQSLHSGALSRTTASTNMNAQSSRSHAIFTLHIKQQRMVKSEENENKDSELEGDNNNQNNEGMSDFETLTAKFHFVDLAGSERLKRTGATGERAKEGISINCGLLALGNVISALGDKSKKASHVPYRDSKLTRLLQDSLGGNSRTLMIACVSPTDRDFMETLNALKYANRARNIKNKVSVNQDKSSRQIAILRVKLQELELELAEYKQGKRIVNEEGVEEINDLFHENTMLQTENNNLRTRIKALQDTIEGQTARISMMLAEQARYAISNLADGDNSEVASMIEGYIKEIEEFRSKVLVLESENARLRRKSEMRSETPYSMNAAHVSITTSGDFSNMEYCESPGTDRVQAILEEAKKDVEKMKQMESGRRSRLPSQGSDKENEPDDERDVDEGEGEGDGDGESADDILDEGEESSSSSDESDSEDKEETQLQEDLAELSCEINIKQKLIEELEISQKRLSTLKMQYEEKMAILENRIKDTQVERDRVLHNLGSIESHSQEKAHKIKEEYEKKIRKMKDELKKLDVAQKEHAKLLRHKSQYERQMKTLSHELDEMKKSKTRLMKNIREEQQKSRERDLKKNREMIQLKKEYRKKDSKIKTLEAEKRQKEIVLRRKQEEVASLRRLQKSNMSDKAAGRVTKRADTSRITNTRDKLPLSAATRKKHQRKGTSEYSTKAAKHKWQSVDKRVQEIVTRRQTILCMEDDMERFMHHRKLLCKDRDKLRRKFKTAQSMGQDNLARDYREQIDSISANIDYVQENIQECQANLVEMTETKDEGESLEATAVINSCTLTEGRYLLEHFLTASIDRGLYSAQRDAYVKELEAKTHQMEQQLLLQQQLLQHVISETDQADLEVEGLLSNPMAEQSSSSSDSSANPSPVDNSRLNNLPANNVPFPNAPDVLPMPPPRSREKARRRTAMATCEDLLYAAGPTPGNDTFIPVSESEPLTFTRNGDDKNNIPDNILMPPPPIRSHSVPKNASSVNNNDTVRSSQSSDSEKNKSIDTDQETNPRPRRGSFTISRTNSSENLLTPPGSPPMRRRFGMDGKNVFSRLSKSNSPKIFHADRGVINAYTGRQSGGKPPLICTHTAEGHTKAVLTVQATEDLLFSGSKDRTVKVWSLETGQEVLSLVGHPNNVVSVKYCEKIGLAFSVSTSYIKIWDIRDGHSTCIKTLSSSGHTLSGGVAITGSRTVAVPAGETSINAIALNESGTMLYSAAGSTVRFWDLRSFQAIGKLVGGHSAAVMTMAVEDADHESDLVITGSKDHYIKVFEVPDEAGGVVTAKHNLEPPHYDGIQSLSISGHTLFSGSRDMCIKKWNLNNQQLLKSINSAHKDWICALEQLPERNCLLSGCRGGILKLWQISDCNLMGEIKAHTSPINAISSNSNCIFTASSDRTVSIWRARGSLDSPSSDTPTDKEEA
uniref:Kinesin-like protein KIF21A-like n=1 Tax=Saccoglossus kowalevskii TaxID=10224 RepID=A0ABM0GLY4_SACKO|nr:PREDICTED: kinesin-like protein KIF21A-like [Saccoglossus kowalevskii]